MLSHFAIVLSYFAKVLSHFVISSVILDFFAQTFFAQCLVI
jgi:hypothetical protein